MRIRGRAWRLGDHITTDHIIPGRLKYKVRTLEEMRQYVFNDLIPGFSERVRPNDVIVAGRNFGYGSSREHAARLLKLVGVGAVVAESFARIFYRNAINVGLPLVEARVEAEDGDEMEVDLREGTVRNLSKGTEESFKPFPPMIMSLLEEGGIESYYKRHGKLPWE
ncbi:MAG: 3-isopropylmalate dehydratase small subunit [Candidatus Korarchaeota archaeon]|nr:3-isopropylmalate dehydratase small subunit [Candidatus Korarchaeota archaeon]